MQIFGPAGVRGNFYDRSPVTINLGTTVDNAAGATIPIADYTVPAFRKAIISAHLMSHVVLIALVAGQESVIRTRVTKSGGGTTFLAQESLPAASAVGSRDSYTTGQIYLNSGDRILAEGVIGAGAGVARQAGGLSGIEYDA